ncbi:hypothetical protein K438DRAFT_1965177 [Mycena galopus ATCC 62051]|nr:hypothetical protein K438DRAFT_1965177 [Mycena galopus ATCC 62051]
MSFNADIVLGALLVGTWANSALYTIEIIQATYYYRHYKNDNWMLKLLVASAIASDSVSMIANYASVYLYTITHWGDLAYLENQYWFDPLYLFATGVVAASAQSFLAGRYWLLTRNKFITLTLFFFITVAVSFYPSFTPLNSDFNRRWQTGGAFACGVTIAIFPEYTNRRKATIPATTWLITEAVTDILIASALLWEFKTAKSAFKETRSLLQRLVAQTIQTGSAGASMALAVLIAFLANKESNVPTGIAYGISRVYCITMLSNLNNRKTGKPWPGKITSSGIHTIETRGERGNQEQSEGGDGYAGIHVHRTAVVHIETPQEFSKTNPGQGVPEIEMAVTDYSSKKKQDLFA